MHMKAMETSARAVCGLLRLLANEHRLLVLCQLVEGERSVGELAASLGVRQPAMSQQVARLRAEGLVETRRAGQSIHYRLARGDVAGLIAYLHDNYCAGQSRPGETST